MPDKAAVAFGELGTRLEPAVRERLASIDIFDTIDSTNTYLMGQTPPAPGMARLAVADHQTEGRGRHDRRWESAPGCSLCVSVAYTFTEIPQAPSAVTLLIGVAVASALDQVGISDIQLKWPNDIVSADAKLGGVLAESKIQDGAMTLVAGIGINIALEAETLQLSGSRWAARATDLRSTGEGTIDRERVLAAVVNTLLPVLHEFDRDGVGERLDEWRKRDWLRGKVVAVESGASRVEGVASGIDDDGALRVETAAGTKRVISGSVSVEMNHASAAS